jgi:hypothetical protein
MVLGLGSLFYVVIRRCSLFKDQRATSKDQRPKT